MNRINLIILLFIFFKQGYCQVILDSNSMIKPNVKIAINRIDYDTLYDWAGNQNGLNNIWDFRFLSKKPLKIDTINTISNIPISNKFTTLIKKNIPISKNSRGFLGTSENFKGMYLECLMYYSYVFGDSVFFDFSKKPFKIYSYPFSYGSSDTSEGDYLSLSTPIAPLNIDSNMVKRYHKYIATSQATGILILPNGSFECLLVKTENYYKDSLFRKINGSSPVLFSYGQTYTYEYHFATSSFNYGILGIGNNGSFYVIDKNFPNFIEETNKLPGSSKIYPNPFINEIKINLSSNNIPLEYKLLDINGSEVSHGITDGLINTENIKSGMYLLQLKNDKLYETYRVIKW
jgi:hypothetical protein